MFETGINNLPSKTHTTRPETIGSSIIAIKYDKGVIIAGDNKISRHGFKNYTNISRIAPINKTSIMGSSGEYSDFQEINRILVEKAEEDELYDGENSFLGPKELSNFLSFSSYQLRNKMTPYWATTMIGGFDENGVPSLYSVDQFGTKLENSYLVSGFALYFSGPILESNVPKDHTKLSKEKAIELLDTIFRVLFYRDASAGDRIIYGVLEKSNINEEPKFELLEKKLHTNWEHDLFKKSHNERYHPTA